MKNGYYVLEIVMVGALVVNSEVLGPYSDIDVVYEIRKESIKNNKKVFIYDAYKEQLIAKG